MTNSIAIFCGSALGSDQIFSETARQVGHTIAEQGKTLVYGGGRSGLMGIVADSALEAGGQVIGVIPHVLRVKCRLRCHAVLRIFKLR